MSCRIYPLFSSSSGNCTYIGSKSAGILIDCGVSCKKITEALSACGIDMQRAVRAVFITHAHSDHVSGLKVLSKRTDAPVFAQSVTRGILEEKELCSRKIDIMPGKLSMPGMTVTAFDTPHDTPQCCGYRVDIEEGGSCASCTDLGHITADIREALRGVNTLLIESNYDDDMLNSCGYPAELRSRIRSDRGHLSNDSCAAFCAELIGSGTKRFILGHISEHSNTCELALRTNREVLAERGFTLNRDYIMTAARPQNSYFETVE